MTSLSHKRGKGASTVAVGTSERNSPLRMGWMEVGVLVLALVLRVALLDVKPAHSDEGVNGCFADQMTQQGFYRYDPTNFHGPLHFYAVFLSQTLFGRNLWALRLPAVIPSLLAVWALLRYREFFNRLTVNIAGIAMAVSPACVFFGRTSIHESWMLLFLVAFLWGVLGLWQRGERRFCHTAVFAAAGMILTKETYVLHLGCFALAAVVLRGWEKVMPSSPPLPVANRLWTRHDAVQAGALSLLIIVFFYSGTFFDFSILRGLYQTFASWVHAGVGEASGHEKTEYSLWGIKPLNYYWVMLLARYEWPALLGLFAAVRHVMPSDARLRYIAIYACGVLVAFSLIPYKTPWCILSIHWPFFLLFGAIVEEACQRWAVMRKPLRSALVAVAAIPLVVSCWVSARLAFFRFDDPNEPYVYVQTFREIRTLTDPLLGMAKSDSRYYHVTGLVLLDSLYPLPWVFGDFTQLSYLSPNKQPAGPIHDDVVVVEKKDMEKVESVLEGNYFKRDFRLREGQGDCVAYLREEWYGRWFLGEKANFSKAASVKPEVKTP